MICATLSFPASDIGQRCARLFWQSHAIRYDPVLTNKLIPTMRSTPELTGAARLALVVAPWTVIPIIAVMLKGGPHLNRWELILSGLYVGGLFGLPLTYAAVLMVGYPAYRLLLAYDHLNVWTLCGTGALSGTLLGAVFVGPEGAIVTAFCGLAVSAVAWLIIRRDLAACYAAQSVGA